MLMVRNLLIQGPKALQREDQRVLSELGDNELHVRAHGNRPGENPQQTQGWPSRIKGRRVSHVRGKPRRIQYE